MVATYRPTTSPKRCARGNRTKAVGIPQLSQRKRLSRASKLKDGNEGLARRSSGVRDRDGAASHATQPHPSPSQALALLDADPERTVFIATHARPGVALPRKTARPVGAVDGSPRDLSRTLVEKPDQLAQLYDP